MVAHWTTAGGERLRVADMDDLHLCNAIRSTEGWACREAWRRESSPIAILKQHKPYQALVAERSARFGATPAEAVGVGAIIAAICWAAYHAVQR